MPRKNKIFQKIFCAVTAIVFSFGIANTVLAATAYFSPSSGSYHVGDKIKVKVMASSDKSMNAMSAKVSFSRNTLKISSVSKASSLISLWPREAVYSNSEGFANFEGVILSGYTGGAGNIITLVFEAKAEGTAFVWFENASILANDGDGTNIFSGGLSKATFDIGKAEIVAEVEKEVSLCPDANQDESKISCVAINMGEKINELESSNNLPVNSLLVTIVVIFIMILVLITIYLLVIIYRLRKYLKEKLFKTEVVITEDFKNLKEDLASKNQANINGENEKIINEIKSTEQDIIKEVESIEDKL